jgi:Tol biopolymer transport system component
MRFWLDRSHFVALLGIVPLAACSDRALIVLGNTAPIPYRFGTPSVITELSAPAKTDNPSLTADLLEIYFTSERAGTPADVWFARRSSRELPFEPPALVTELSSPTLETSPVVSADGLTLWLASDRPRGLGDLDVWVARRDRRDARWSAPVNLPELSSPGKDIPRPLGLHDSVMPIGSDRDTRGYYQIYLAARDSASKRFATPAPLTALELPRESTVDGFLTDDGLTLFYCVGPAVGAADLFVASRKHTDDVFGQRVALDDLNSDNDERDPFLSDDGELFFFSSDRSGHYEIYVSEARREPVAIER